MESFLGAYLVLSPGARIRTLIFLGIFITVVQLPAIIVIGFFIVIHFIEGFASLPHYRATNTDAQRGEGQDRNSAAAKRNCKKKQ